MGQSRAREQSIFVNSKSKATQSFADQKKLEPVELGKCGTVSEREMGNCIARGVLDIRRRAGSLSCRGTKECRVTAVITFNALGPTIDCTEREYIRRYSSGSGRPDC